MSDSGVHGTLSLARSCNYSKARVHVDIDGMRWTTREKEESIQSIENPLEHASQPAENIIEQSGGQNNSPD